MINVFGTNNCDEIILPAICDEPIFQVEKSQISGLIVLPDNVAPPTYWTSYEQWQAVIGNSKGDNSAAKLFTGIGELSEPDEVIAELGKSYKKVSQRAYTLEFDASIYTDAEYLTIRRLQGNYRAFRLWFITIAGRIVGGAKGIKPGFVTAASIYGKSRTDYELGRITIEWRADTDAPRASLPQLLYGNDPAIIPDGGTPDTPVDESSNWMTDESGQYPIYEPS